MSNNIRKPKGVRLESAAVADLPPIQPPPARSAPQPRPAANPNYYGPAKPAPQPEEARPAQQPNRAPARGPRVQSPLGRVAGAIAARQGRASSGKAVAVPGPVRAMLVVAGVSDALWDASLTAMFVNYGHKGYEWFGYTVPLALTFSQFLIWYVGWKTKLGKVLFPMLIINAVLNYGGLRVAGERPFIPTTLFDIQFWVDVVIAIFVAVAAEPLFTWGLKGEIEQ